MKVHKKRRTAIRCRQLGLEAVKKGERKQASKQGGSIGC